MCIDKLADYHRVKNNNIKKMEFLFKPIGERFKSRGNQYHPVINRKF